VLYLDKAREDSYLPVCLYNFYFSIHLEDLWNALLQNGSSWMEVVWPILHVNMVHYNYAHHSRIWWSDSINQARTDNSHVYITLGSLSHFTASYNCLERLLTRLKVDHGIETHSFDKIGCYNHLIQHQVLQCQKGIPLKGEAASSQSAGEDQEAHFIRHNP